jgi:hypothetical protein
MRSFFDDLEAQLGEAARAQTAALSARRRNRERDPRPPRRWIAAAVRAVPVGLAVLTTLVVAVVALSLLHHGRGSNAAHGSASQPPSSNGPVQLLPTHPNRVQRQEINYLYVAQETAARRDQVCNPDRALAAAGDPGRRPSLSRAPPSAATLALLSVLRRPAVASDKLPPRVIGAPPDQHVYPNGTIPPVKDVYVRYVRKARHRFGANYYLVPAGDINQFVAIPARCWAEQRAALRHEMPRIPAPLRAGTLALQSRFIAQQRHNQLPYPGVCLVAVNGTGNGGGGCDAGGSLRQIQNGTGSMPSGAPTGVGVLYGLVPDGIRTVTFEYQRHRPVTVLAIDNVIIVRRRGLPNYGFPNTILWRAADGKILKVIHRP